MTIDSEKQAGVLIVTPPPRLDTTTAPEFERDLTAAIQGGETRLVLNFAKTGYVSSVGLRVLLKAAKLVTPQGGALVLCHLSSQVREVLEISGFLGLLPACGSLREALAKAGGQP